MVSPTSVMMLPSRIWPWSGHPLPLEEAQMEMPTVWTLRGESAGQRRASAGRADEEWMGEGVGHACSAGQARPCSRDAQHVAGAEESCDGPAAQPAAAMRELRREAQHPADCGPGGGRAGRGERQESARDGASWPDGKGPLSTARWPHLPSRAWLG